MKKTSLENAITNGLPFVAISETEDGRIIVEGSAGPDFILKYLPAVLEGALTVENRNGEQHRVVSIETIGSA